MNVLRNTVTTPGMQLPLVHTSFLVRCASIMRKPDHSLYTAVNNFLLAKPSLYLGEVPMFIDCFLQTDPKKITAQRMWELQMLHTAIRTSSAGDNRIWKKSSVFGTIFAEHDNPVCDHVSHDLIENIAERILTRWTPAPFCKSLPHPALVNCIATVIRWLVRIQSQQNENTQCSESFADTMVSLSMRNSAMVQVLSPELISAGSLMINSGFVDQGLTVLKAVSDVVPAVFQSSQFVSMLERVMQAAVDANNIQQAEKVAAIITSLVPPDQERPPLLESLLRRIVEGVSNQPLCDSIMAWMTPSME